MGSLLESGPLPAELTIEILEYLEYRELLRCRLVRTAQPRSRWCVSSIRYRSPDGSVLQSTTANLFNTR